MTTTERRCPDCGVGMEAGRLAGAERFVLDEPRDGLLGRVGVKEQFDVDAVVCPECGLIRAYADVDE
ncbi:hypothetical protein [Natronoarchaeum rubrum]|uniref:hypothetical protein n=1 Tax=Natronoarchaeum rubrum TaxID=755311 RepID=UPI002111D1BB|nr:hypothetical protein [Natronoarchaeum rubrum]HMB50037.1 hypothetical protein [Natronoarchaeum rubrum]